MLSRAVLLVAVTTALSPAEAQTLHKTPELLSRCRAVQEYRKYPDPSGVPAFSAVQCLAYLHGFVAALVYGPRGITCIPQQVSGEQMAAVYVKWGDANPHEWHKDAWETVMKALVSEFPCRSE